VESIVGCAHWRTNRALTLFGIANIASVAAELSASAGKMTPLEKAVCRIFVGEKVLDEFG
jgi:hypothetical protein